MILFAGVAVSDFTAAVGWYERLLGRPADVLVSDHETMWNMSKAGWMYVVENPARAGHALVTVATDDLVATVAKITLNGIVGGPIEGVGDAGQKVTYTDADGNEISFIEVKSR